MQFEHMGEEELDQYAHHAAEYLWCTARSDPSALKIVQVRACTRVTSGCILGSVLFRMVPAPHPVALLVRARARV